MSVHKTYSSFNFQEQQHLLTPKQNGLYSMYNSISARRVLSLMAFLGFFNVFAMRVNISVGIVAMTKFRAHDATGNSSDSGQCPGPDDDGDDDGDGMTMTPTMMMMNSTIRQSEISGEFDWDEKTQGYILGAFFYGYIITNIAGAWLVTRIGGKTLLGVGILSTSVLTLLTPVAARCSVYLLIALRVLEGVGEGVTYPAMHAMWGFWAPEMERTKLSVLAYSGAMVGTVVTFPVASLLCESDFLGGWPSVFYVFGTLGCVWCVVWMVFAHNTPAEHPRISKEEREYIEDSIGKQENTDNLPIPWKDIVTSMPVIAICVGHHCSQWKFFTLLTCLPTYLKTIQKFDLKSNGLLSALPYLCLSIVMNIMSVLADYVRSKGWMSTTTTRKVFSSVGFAVPSLLLIACGYTGCDKILVVTLLTLSLTFHAAIYGGFLTNQLDIAPKFAGVLMGLTNGLGTIPGSVAPLVVGYLTDGNQTVDQWRKIFIINGAIGIFGFVFYNIFAKGDEQAWARISGKGDNGKCVNSVHESIDHTEDKMNDKYYLLNGNE